MEEEKFIYLAKSRNLLVLEFKFNSGTSLNDLVAETFGWSSFTAKNIFS